MINVRNLDKEQVIAVGVFHKKRLKKDAEISLNELVRLIDAAGAATAHQFMCRVESINASTYIGHGKTLEIASLVLQKEADLVAFDELLSPAQQRNLENALECRVIDRSGIILDIFAQRAKSNEGKLQVELAQLEYLLPRLTHLWTHFSRLGAGIGTRGPGETQLELDRRRLKTKIQRIKDELDKIKQRRTLQRKRRKKMGCYSIALVGYTNAGKSTLVNQLTGATVEVKDQLFATLDPTLRMLELPSKERIIVSDTVGFISNLPHQLVAAFHATLEEVMDADLLIHVIDSSSPNFEKEISDVGCVLEELHCESKPIILAYNKTDLNQDFLAGETWIEDGKPAVAISALIGNGVQGLIELIQHHLADHQVKTVFRVPYSQASIQATIQRHTQVHQIEYLPNEVELHVSASPAIIQKFHQYRLENGAADEIDKN